MRSGWLVALGLLWGCGGPCPHTCPVSFELTLVLSDAAGHPLTPRELAVTEFSTGGPSRYSCDTPRARCTENRITVVTHCSQPTVWVEATTGETFSGPLEPTWTPPATHAGCCAPGNASSVELTLR